MGSNIYERKLTDEFFNSEIGSTIKDAIYNNMTIVCNTGDFITGGEYNSNDVSIIYEPYTHKPIIRNGNIWYRDTLLADTVSEDGSIAPAHIHTTYSTSNGERFVYMVNWLNGGKPFNLIWSTIIIVNNKAINTYIRKIKVIPEDMPEE